MSKRGLPNGVQMRHDSHYVEEFAHANRSVGRKIQIDLIEPNPEQPRTDVGDLTELSGSIKEKGVLEPILVKPNPQAGKWMIIAGERRWRAANLAGLTEIPCIELDISDKDVAEIALIENLQRKDLTVWEEVDGYAYLINKFDYTHEEIAKKIGKSRTTITESLTIAGLPESIRAKCRQSAITAKSALLEIARQFDEQAMHDFLDVCAKKSIKNPSAANGGKRLKNGNAFANNNSINTNNAHSVQKFDDNLKFSFGAETFDLEIHFHKKDAFNKNDVLNALKEVFNLIKKQDEI
ncbi:MAG: ParB/RepB/Spo0J family partition protein [Acidobacteria bacterium]|nr:ParB/RepB/Spo0J family partition protein [Acidobacteriota bacterium]